MWKSVSWSCERITAGDEAPEVRRAVPKAAPAISSPRRAMIDRTM